ncbi:MAG TPA: PQQ-dependent sugar dehydrogenase, partial [Chloroflexota bacterium]
GPDGSPTSKAVNLPAGFSIAQFASGLRSPRFMTFDDAGNLLVADAGAGNVYRYAASGGAVAASDQPPAPLLSGLEAPSNVVLHNGYLYVGETRTISRYAYDPNAAPGSREAIVSDLPRGGHNTRTVVFDIDGSMLVAVGSSCNICDESDARRAAILRFAADGSGQQRLAYGLRNPVGLAIQPGSGLLWATVNERDNQGNELPPDLVTVVREGQNFGWPGCQPPNATPQDAGRDCSGITPPTVGIQAHSAPLGLSFYTGQQFPGDYANDLFVVQHGSWNRQPPAEPKLLRLHLVDGQPISAQDFATGWQNTDGSRWGRPAGVTVAPDGSLIVSDDQAGSLYRIAFGG